MAIIEYDKSPNISPEQRLKSLADSVRRAFEEIEKDTSIPVTTESVSKEEIQEIVNGSLENVYLKTGGIIEGDVILGEGSSIRSRYGQLLALNNNDNTILGYGSYENSVGSAYIYGYNGVYLRTYGRVHSSSSVCVPNDYSFAGTGTDGGYYGLMCLSSGDNVLIGYGPYANNFGNNTLVYANNDICLRAKRQVILEAKGEQVYLYNDGTDTYFNPTDTGAVCLGSSGHQWYQVYSQRLVVTVGRLQCEPSYTNTCSYATNVYVGNTGLFTRTTNTSSRTIKHDIKSLSSEELKAEKLYDLDVVQFKYNEGIITDEEDARYGKDLVGFIIENMNEIYPIAVDKPSDDVKEWSWNAQYLIPPMLKLIQDLRKEVDELKGANNEG